MSLKLNTFYLEVALVIAFHPSKRKVTKTVLNPQKLTGVAISFVKVWLFWIVDPS